MIWGAAKRSGVVISRVRTTPISLTIIPTLAPALSTHELRSPEEPEVSPDNRLTFTRLCEGCAHYDLAAVKALKQNSLTYYMPILC